MAHDGEHRNAAVLHLHVPEALEPLLVGVGQEAERVPEAEGGLGADLGLEGHLHGGRGLGRGGQGGSVEGAAKNTSKKARAAGKSVGCLVNTGPGV